MDQFNILKLESTPRVQTSTKPDEYAEYDPGLSQNIINSFFDQAICIKKLHKNLCILFLSFLNHKLQIIENQTVVN